MGGSGKWKSAQPQALQLEGPVAVLKGDLSDERQRKEREVGKEHRRKASSAVFPGKQKDHPHTFGTPSTEDPPTRLWANPKAQVLTVYLPLTPATTFFFFPVRTTPNLSWQEKPKTCAIAPSSGKQKEGS